MVTLKYFLMIAIFIQCTNGFAQDRMMNAEFRDCRTKEISDLVINFGANRESFDNYSWMATVSNEKARFYSNSKDSYSELEFLCCESVKTKSLRRDMRMTTYHELAIEPGSWESVFSQNGKGRRILAATELSTEVIFRGGFMPPCDPWNWAIACQSALEHGLPTPTYWSVLLDKDKLVASQKAERLGQSIYRGEWKFGKNSNSRLMVLFASANDNMPFYCRYHTPADPEIPFNTNSKVYLEEVMIEWTKLSSGWAPSRVRNNRDSFDEKGKLMSTRSLDTKFTWGPKADAIENVFEPRAVLPEQLIEIISDFKPDASDKNKEK